MALCRHFRRRWRGAQLFPRNNDIAKIAAILSQCKRASQVGSWGGVREAVMVAEEAIFCAKPRQRKNGVVISDYRADAILNAAQGHF